MKQDKQSEFSQISLQLIIERLEKKFWEDFDERLFDIYIPPRGGLVRESPETFEMVQAIIDFVDNPEKASLLILGDPGQGKTLLSLWMAKSYWERRKKNDISNMIPLWIWLPAIPLETRRDKLLEIYFEQKGLLQSEIAAIQNACQNQHCQLLLLLDGLDEIAVGEENFYLSNGWWNTDWPTVKVMACCRPEAFAYHTNHLNYQRLFYTQPADVPNAHKRFLELCLQPFTIQDIESYLKAYVRGVSLTLESTLASKEDIQREAKEGKQEIKEEKGVNPAPTDWSDWSTYQHYIKTIQPLALLAQNPFVLSILAQTLPRIVAEVAAETERKDQADPSITAAVAQLYTRERVYRVFVQDWFESQADRILKDPEKEKLLYELGHHTKESLKPRLLACLFTYSENLARLALNLGDGKLDVILTEEMTLRPELLTPPPGEAPYINTVSLIPSVLPLIRSGCLLKCQGNTYRFLHKTIVEYLAARALFNSMHVAAEAYVNGLQLEEVHELFSFNENLLLKEPQIIHLLADLVQPQPAFKQLLYATIALSKEEPLLGTAAANAITILNVAGEAFTGQDFRGIHIPGADLTSAICTYTDFSGANLARVRLANTWLHGTQFIGANLTEVYLGELPSLQHNTIVLSVVLEPSEKWIFISDAKGRISQWEVATGKKINQWDIPTSGVVAHSIKTMGMMLNAQLGSISAISPDSRWLLVNGWKSKGLNLDSLEEAYLLDINQGTFQQPAWLKALFLNDLYITTKFTQRDNKTLILFCDGKTMTMHEMSAKTHLASFPFSTHEWTLSSNGQLIAAIVNQTLLFYDVAAFLQQGMPISPIPSGIIWQEKNSKTEHRFETVQNGTLFLGLIKESAPKRLELFLFKGFSTSPHSHSTYFVLNLSQSKGNIKNYLINPRAELLIIPSALTLEVWHIESAKHLYNLPLPISLLGPGITIEKASIQFSHMTPQLYVALDKMLYTHFLQNNAYNLYPRYQVKSFQPTNKGSAYDVNDEFTQHPDALNFALNISKRKGELIISYENEEPKSFYFKVGSKQGFMERTVYYLSDKASDAAIDRQCLLASSPNQRYVAFCYSFKEKINVEALSTIIPKPLYSTAETLFPLGADTSIRLWDLEQQKLVHCFSHHNQIFGMFFSADSTWLITVGMTLRIWDIKSGRCLHHYNKHTGVAVDTAALSEDKQWLALLDSAGNLELWITRTHQCIFKIPALPMRPTQLDFSQDGGFLKGRGEAGEEVLFALYHGPDSKTPQLRLIQRSAPFTLYAYAAKVDQAYGLSSQSQLLLHQRGAVGKSAVSTSAPGSANTTAVLTQDQVQQGLIFQRSVIDRRVMSEVDSRYPIDYHNWVISFLRDTKSQKNDAHTFILVEGMNAYGRLIFYRYDLATRIGEQTVESGFARVAIEAKASVPLELHLQRLNALINPRTEKGRGIESVVGFAWSVTREEALILDKSIRADQARGLIKYHALGDTALISQDSHNCYTWARKHLLALKNKKIAADLPVHFTDYFGAHPKVHLTLAPEDRVPVKERQCLVM